MPNYKKNLTQPQEQRLKDLEIKVHKHLSFSFEFFREREFFGIGDCDVHWFSSLLVAIRNYSEKELSENKYERSARFHKIKWSQPNIPISFNDLNWLPKNDQVLVGQDEIFQLSITQGSGRIIGFIVGNTFYVVLLDPKHNMQPSIDYDFAVNHTTQSITQYDELRSKYDLLYKLTNATLTIEQKNKITLSESQRRLLYVKLSEDDLNNYNSFCSTATFNDMVDAYTYYMLEKETK